MAYAHPRARFKGIAALALMTITLWGTLWGFASVAQGAQKTILFLGDSIAAGYGLPEEDSLPARLEKALHARGVDARVINGGISGDTTAGGRARLDWALSAEPDYVIVELGGNDGLRGLDPARTRSNLDAILGELKSRDIGILLTGMYAPPNLGERYAREFNDLFPALAEKHGVALYPFILEGVALDPTLNQPDGIHPNARGVTVIVDNLLPHVLRLLRHERAAERSAE